MRFYKPQEHYQYFCGIDLHTRTMHLGLNPNAKVPTFLSWIDGGRILKV